MLVRSDNRAIIIGGIPIQLPCGIGVLLDSRKEGVPEARLLPAGEAAGHGPPGTVARRQGTPGGSGTEEPHDAVEDAAMVDCGTTGMRFLRRQQRLESLPLFLG